MSLNNRKPYLVWAPDYVNHSAGHRVLHRLCHLLNEAGESAYIYKGKTNKQWNTPRLRGWQAKRLVENGAIVVYPEVVSGNPLRARHVVRYLLNHPGLLGGDKKYDPREILFCYSNNLLQPGMAMDRILSIPAVRTDIFYREPSITRDIDYLVYFGKHGPVTGFPKKKIIGITKPSTVQVGDLLRRCQKLICFDNMTALAFEASLCGCPVVIIPDGTRTKEQAERSEFGLNGIAWGESPEEFERALKTLDQAQHALQKVNLLANEALARFIAITRQGTKGG